MLDRKAIEDSIIHSGHTDPLERFRDHLGDLLQIHMENLYEGSAPEWGSLFLIGSQYVCGEKSAERSFMRFLIKISPAQEEGEAGEETLILELSVRKALAYAR